MRLKMKWWLPAVLTVVSVAFVGCEWEAGDGDFSWSSRYGWVNFSGVYRGVGGGVLVTDYTVTPGTPGSTNRTEEQVGVTRAGQSTYGGRFSHGNVKPGTVQIRAGVFVLTDNGSGGLSGSGKTGSIDYGTGGWSIDLLGEYPPAGTPIIASYQYILAGSSGTGSAGPGSSGKTIHAFTVNHQGNVVEITDNNGCTYKGKFSSVKTTGGVDQDSSPEAQQQVTPGTTVVGSFSASGTSAAGLQVSMVGTFQGVVQGSGSSLSLADRRIFGTWIEKGGKTGDINGQASPISISVPETTTTTE